VPAVDQVTVTGHPSSSLLSVISTWPSYQWEHYRGGIGAVYALNAGIPGASVIESYISLQRIDHGASITAHMKTT